MVGLGESKDELLRTLDDLREHDVDMLTVGQYLQPSVNHLLVERFVYPDEFAEYTAYAEYWFHPSGLWAPSVLVIMPINKLVARLLTNQADNYILKCRQ